MPAEPLLVREYLQHLTTGDADLLASFSPSSLGQSLGEVGTDPVVFFRILSTPALFDAVFGPSAADGGLASTCSPFLAFAVVVERAADELEKATFVVERLTPRLRAPVFDVAQLREFLADRWRRLFLAELLASYTHVASGSVLVSTRRGWRRQRFSELDPVQMASLAQSVPTNERPGVYRRLGDLALFLTGVFPDAVARRGLGPLEEGRLLRAAAAVPEAQAPPAVSKVPAALGDDRAVTLLDHLGRLWYRAAAGSVPKPVPANLRVLAELPNRFGEGRRVLTLITDRFFFSRRSAWFGLEA